MSAPVDVLAWIDMATTGLHCLSKNSPTALRGKEVYAAVAELVAERDALRKRITDAPMCKATRNGVVRTIPGTFEPRKRVALVMLEDDEVSK